MVRGREWRRGWGWRDGGLLAGFAVLAGLGGLFVPPLPVRAQGVEGSGDAAAPEERATGCAAQLGAVREQLVSEGIEELLAAPLFTDMSWTQECSPPEVEELTAAVVDRVSRNGAPAAALLRWVLEAEGVVAAVTESLRQWIGEAELVAAPGDFEWSLARQRADARLEGVQARVEELEKNLESLKAEAETRRDLAFLGLVVGLAVAVWLIARVLRGRLRVRKAGLRQAVDHGVRVRRPDGSGAVLGGVPEGSATGSPAPPSAELDGCRRKVEALFRRVGSLETKIKGNQAGAANPEADGATADAARLEQRTGELESTVASVRRELEAVHMKVVGVSKLVQGTTGRREEVDVVGELVGLERRLLTESCRRLPKHPDWPQIARTLSAFNPDVAPVLEEIGSEPGRPLEPAVAERAERLGALAAGCQSLVDELPHAARGDAVLEGLVVDVVEPIQDLRELLGQLGWAVGVATRLAAGAGEAWSGREPDPERQLLQVRSAAGILGSVKQPETRNQVMDFDEGRWRQGLLDLADRFLRVYQEREAEDQAASLAKAREAIDRALAEFCLEPIQIVLGETDFDGSLHEQVATRHDPGVRNGVVVEVQVNGFKEIRSGRVKQPAQVVVNRRPS